MKSILLLFCVMLFNLVLPQEKKIRFKKNQEMIFFFQKGKTSDVIVKDQSDIFYLSVPDSLKPWISIQVNNGRLIKFSGDTLLRAECLKGMRYESLFQNLTMSGDSLHFVTRVDGASALPTPQFSILFTDRKKNQVILERIFTCPQQ
jgi:hypothetical protein